jgi:hypothetical protein
MKDKDFFPTGLGQGEKTKTNYNLSYVVIASLVAALSLVIWRLTDPLRGILTVLLVLALISCPFWIPFMMNRLPPSETYKVNMAKLGYEELDGKIIPLEKMKLTVAPNPPQLPPAPPKTKEDGTKE